MSPLIVAIILIIIIIIIIIIIMITMIIIITRKALREHRPQPSSTVPPYNDSH